MSELPTSWQEVEIVEVLAPNDNGKPFQQGWSPQCERFPAPEGSWGVLKTTAIQHGEFWPHENKALPEHLEPRPQIEVRAGDVVMTCAGPRSRCGVACLVEHTRRRLMLSGKMYRFRPHPDGLEPKYLAYLIQRHETQLEIDRMKTGINDSGLNLTHDRFAALRVPLAPLREQHRIVAKIEELFSELDKAVESLTLARAQLKTYRQALLKAAFEGRLTADWRAANPDKLEPPETLLARIRTEREARHKQALADWKKQGAIGRAPKKPVFVEPTYNENSNDPLPVPAHGWSSTKIGDLFEVCIGATPSRKRVDYWGGSINWVSSGEVQFCTIASTKERITEAGFKSISADMHPAGTVMLGMIGEGKTRGQAAILTAPATHNQNCAAIRVAESPVPSAYVYRFLQYMYDATRRVGSGNNQKALNKERIQNMTIPVASPLEMERIVQDLEASLSQVDAIEDEIDAATAKTSALRQSILKQAFSGQLVPQDPADEPASALLARLREEAPTARTRRRRTA